MDINNRSDKHKRNDDVESIFNELKSLITKVEPSVGNFDEKLYKNIFIFGCPRSGTTFLHQRLIKQLDVCYPTNFISRFFYSPYIGSLYQKLLYDLDTRNEVLNNQKIEETSLLGKTKGAMSPNEFWYFWREHFDVLESGYIANPNENQLKSFYNSLNKIKNTFGKPIVLKGLIANNNIDKLINYNNDDIVIHIERNVDDNAKSLLRAREEFYNDENKWYSFKSDNYNELINKKPYEQTTGQVINTNNMIKNKTKNIKYLIHIKYEDFCENENKYIDKIKELL
jgi:hypothetical protein